jgi:23S rRNA 5-hydroxycytidine C2501 synthase
MTRQNITALELLAPAGNAEIGIAAIDHGADAVYIGAPRFSARADAGVEIHDIARLIDYAHLYYAKVYVALNTILTDQEITEAERIIHDLYDLGTDGLIIQDVGILELDLPPIPLIASTQMHNSSVEKVKFLESSGFKRVILARELSLPDIAGIRANTSIELEAFVHGALCVSYSGQCYMSQATCGRSGNRGVCAQPCRFPYSLTDGYGKTIEQDKYLLCLKDLNLIDCISDLVKSGITSFKIEGRYKPAEYVKNITAAYRNAIDRLIAERNNLGRPSSGVSSFTFTPDPGKTFNRGYCRYFLFGKHDKIGSLNTQKSIGSFIGKVTSIGKDHFQTDCRDLVNGDGLCFFKKKGGLSGFRVEKVVTNNIFPNKMKDLEIGTELFRNHDAVFNRLLSGPSAKRQIDVVMDFFQDDSSVRLAVRDEDDVFIEHTLEVPYETAKNSEQAHQQIETHLRRSGNSLYSVKEVHIHAPSPGFLPVRFINSLRRDSLAALTEKRLKHYRRTETPHSSNGMPYPLAELDFHGNVLNDKARTFYERHGARITEGAFETIGNVIGKTVMTCRFCLRYELNACTRIPNTAKKLHEPLHISDGKNRYRLHFDCIVCRMSVIYEGSQS